MNNLKKLRLKKGLNQNDFIDDLEKKTGLKISFRTLSYWESGDRKIRFEKAKILSDYFDCSLINFMDSKELQEQFKDIQESVNNFKILLDNEALIENMETMKVVYSDIKNHFDNPKKFDLFTERVSHHEINFIYYIHGLLEFDKEDGSNEGELLINYLLLEDSDKAIAFDLIKKLAEKGI